MGNSKRQSGIELLRIVAMIQIIILHIYNFGKLSAVSNQIGGFSDICADFLWAFCRCPVYVFLLITGYFLSESKPDLRSAKKRISGIYKPMIFYSLLLSGIFLVFAPRYFGKTAGEAIPKAMQAFFPFLSRTWYFLTIFLIVLALSPFLNTMLQKLEKQQYLVLLSILFFVFSVWPVLAKIAPLNTVFSVKTIVRVDEGKSLYCFAFIYLIGGYIKRFVPQKEKFEFGYLILYALCCLCDFTLNCLSPNPKGGYGGVFGWFSNPFMIFAAIFLFLAFRSLRFQSRFVNFVSAGVFGVYMIHEFRFVREWIWNHVNFKRWDGDVPYMLFKIAAIVFLIFTVCNLVEQGRIFLFSRVENGLKKRKENLKNS